MNFTKLTGEHVPVNYSSVENYLKNDFPKVEGWCIPQLWNCIEPILDYHRKIELNKPIAEIGVYHGKFFIGLAKSAQTDLPSHAFDVFDMQQFNMDGAGIGSLEKLMHNIESCGMNKDDVSINRVDSMRLDEQSFEQYGLDRGHFSLFSVDGCHTPEHTINDTKTAISLTCPEGIVFVDDYYNPSWPGVQEGISKFYFNEYSKFVPLLFTSGKLFLCHISYHSIYLDAVAKHIQEHYSDSRVKMVKRFGYDTLTVTPNYQSTTYLVKTGEQLVEQVA